MPSKEDMFWIVGLAALVFIAGFYFISRGMRISKPN